MSSPYPSTKGEDFVAGDMSSTITSGGSTPVTSPAPEGYDLMGRLLRSGRLTNEYMAKSAIKRNTSSAFVSAGGMGLPTYDPANFSLPAAAVPKPYQACSDERGTEHTSQGHNQSDAFSGRYSHGAPGNWYPAYALPESAPAQLRSTRGHSELESAQPPAHGPDAARSVPEPAPSTKPASRPSEPDALPDSGDVWLWDPEAVPQPSARKKAKPSTDPGPEAAPANSDISAVPTPKPAAKPRVKFDSHAKPEDGPAPATAAEAVADLIAAGLPAAAQHAEAQQYHADGPRPSWAQKKAEISVTAEEGAYRNPAKLASLPRYELDRLLRRLGTAVDDSGFLLPAGINDKVREVMARVKVELQARDEANRAQHMGVTPSVPRPAADEPPTHSSPELKRASNVDEFMRMVAESGAPPVTAEGMDAFCSAPANNVDHPTEDGARVDLDSGFATEDDPWALTDGEEALQALRDVIDASDDAQYSPPAGARRRIIPINYPHMLETPASPPAAPASMPALCRELAAFKAGLRAEMQREMAAFRASTVARIGQEQRDVVAELKAQLGAQLKADIKAELKREIRPELTAGITHRLETEFRGVVRTAAEREVRSRVARCPCPSLGALKAEVKHELVPELARTLRAQGAQLKVQLGAELSAAWEPKLRLTRRWARADAYLQARAAEKKIQAGVAEQVSDEMSRQAARRPSLLAGAQRDGQQGQVARLQAEHAALRRSLRALGKRQDELAAGGGPRPPALAQLRSELYDELNAGLRESLQAQLDDASYKDVVLREIAEADERCRAALDAALEAHDETLDEALDARLAAKLEAAGVRAVDGGIPEAAPGPKEPLHEAAPTPPASRAHFLLALLLARGEGRVPAPWTLLVPAGGDPDGTWELVLPARAADDAEAAGIDPARCLGELRDLAREWARAHPKRLGPVHVTWDDFRAAREEAEAGKGKEKESELDRFLEWAERAAPGLCFEDSPV